MAREYLSSPIIYYPWSWVEHTAKKVVFGCQQCGQCILSYTAFTCPMNCPKQLRNGPCGGTRPKGMCEVYPERRCVWHKIYTRNKSLNRLPLMRQIQPAVDWTLEHTPAWINVFQKKIKPPHWFVPKEMRSKFKF